MEFGLGELQEVKDAVVELCLNPCFSGIWSRSIGLYLVGHPYVPVLILVLVEFGLGDQTMETIQINDDVLILVLVEFGLGEPAGRGIATQLLVLILVLVEFGLGERMHSL